MRPKYIDLALDKLGDVINRLQPKVSHGEIALAAALLACHELLHDGVTEEE